MTDEGTFIVCKLKQFLKAFSLIEVTVDGRKIDSKFEHHEIISFSISVTNDGITIWW